MVNFYGKIRYSRLFGHPEHQFNFFLINLEEPVRKIMNPAFNFVFGRHLGPKFDFFATV